MGNWPSGLSSETLDLHGHVGFLRFSPTRHDFLLGQWALGLVRELLVIYHQDLCAMTAPLGLLCHDGIDMIPRYHSWI